MIMVSLRHSRLTLMMALTHVAPCFLLFANCHSSLAKEPAGIEPVFSAKGARHIWLLPDPKLILSGGEVWNIETKRRAYSLEMAIDSNDVIFSEDKKYAATLDRVVTLLDLDKKVATKVNDYRTEYAAFSPNSRLLATFDMVKDFDQPRSLVIWNIKKRAIQAAVPMANNPDSPLVFSADSDHLYCLTKDKLLEIAAETGKIEREALRKSHAYRRLELLNTDDRLYAFDNSDLGARSALDAFALSKDKFGATTPVLKAVKNLVHNGSQLAAVEKNEAVLFDKNGKELWRFNAHERDCNSVAISGDGKWMLTGGDDWRVKLWSTESRSLAAWMVPTKQSIAEVEFTANGKHFCVRSDLRNTLWETRELAGLKNGSSK